MRLTVSILEDDAHHVSLSAGVFVHQPQWLHLGVHKPALVCAARPNTLRLNTRSLRHCQNRKRQELSWNFFFLVETIVQKKFEAGCDEMLNYEYCQTGMHLKYIFAHFRKKNE